MKKAIVTGASSGLGKKIAAALISKGVKVVNLSKSKSEIAGIVNMKVDLSKHDDLMKVIVDIKKKHRDLDLLVCCAGLMHRNFIGKIPNESVDYDFSVNVTSNIKLTNALLPILKKNQGDIVMVGSTSSFLAHPETAVYNSTKFALLGYIKSLQKELKKENVRVIGFHPGGFQSNLHILAKSQVKQKDLIDPKDLAMLLMSILSMPRNAQVSEIIIDRKNV
jgi:short-subunit dehydrogenase